MFCWCCRVCVSHCFCFDRMFCDLLVVHHAQHVMLYMFGDVLQCVVLFVVCFSFVALSEGFCKHFVLLCYCFFCEASYSFLQLCVIICNVIYTCCGLLCVFVVVLFFGCMFVEFCMFLWTEVAPITPLPHCQAMARSPGRGSLAAELHTRCTKEITKTTKTMIQNYNKLSKLQITLKSFKN